MFTLKPGKSDSRGAETDTKLLDGQFPADNSKKSCGVRAPGMTARFR